MKLILFLTALLLAPLAVLYAADAPKPNIVLIFREEGVGELEVRFTLPPDATHLEMGFAFRNLGKKPVRLRKVTVTDGAFLQKLDRASLRLLAGHSSKGPTQVVRSSKLNSENNLLVFFADRHLMQGYVDLVEKPVWDAARSTLSGTSAVVGGEPYRVTLALNGATPVGAEAKDAQVTLTVRKQQPELADLIIEAGENKQVVWKVRFERSNP